MSFDAIEKYNTRLLIPKETGMFATVAVLSNGRQKDDTKEHVQRESPLTSFQAVCQVPFSVCVQHSLPIPAAFNFQAPIHNSITVNNNWNVCFLNFHKILPQKISSDNFS